MTIEFPQVSKAAAQSKMKRLVGNTVYGRIGFADFFLKRTTDEEVYRGAQRIWWIEATSTHHSEITLRNMYRTNGKSW